MSFLSKVGLVVALSVVVTCCVFAQTASGVRSYDAASIKKVDGACVAAGSGPMQIGPGRIALGCVTTHVLIQMAFNELYSPQHHRIVRVTGGPPWMDSVHYSFEAKAAGASGSEMAGVLLQDMLKQRLHLQIHTEPKDTPVYFLTAGDHGAKLKPADSKACMVRDFSVFPPPRPATMMPYCGAGSGHATREAQIMDAYSIEIPSFAVELSGTVQRDVIDKTEITGKYDIHLEYSKDLNSPGPVMLNGAPAAPMNTDPTGAVSIFTALQKETGLKLTAGTAPLDVIVVDHVEPPTEN
jgi:uncharacterized protein (TIGR03435 family)